MQTMVKQEKMPKSLGLDSSHLRQMRKDDPVLEELLSDYRALSRDLDVVKNSSSTDAKKFQTDAQASLRAIEMEIKERFSSVSQVENLRKVDK